MFPERKTHFYAVIAKNGNKTYRSILWMEVQMKYISFIIIIKMIEILHLLSRFDILFSMVIKLSE